MLSALATPPRTRKSLICSATWIATLTCASLVDAPRCGVEMKPGVRWAALAALVGSGVAAYVAAGQLLGAFDLREMLRMMRRRSGQ